MTTPPPRVPYTETFTLNVDDNPIAVYLAHDNEGNPCWRLRANDRLNPLTIKTLLLDLNTFTTRWYLDNYGSGAQRMTPPLADPDK